MAENNGNAIGDGRERKWRRKVCRVTGYLPSLRCHRYAGRLGWWASPRQMGMCAGESWSQRIRTWQTVSQVRNGEGEWLALGTGDPRCTYPGSIVADDHFSAFAVHCARWEVAKSALSRWLNWDLAVSSNKAESEESRKETDGAIIVMVLCVDRRAAANHTPKWISTGRLRHCTVCWCQTPSRGRMQWSQEPEPAHYRHLLREKSADNLCLSFCPTAICP